MFKIDLFVYHNIYLSKQGVKLWKTLKVFQIFSFQQKIGLKGILGKYYLSLERDCCQNSIPFNRSNRKIHKERDVESGNYASTKKFLKHNMILLYRQIKILRGLFQY